MYSNPVQHSRAGVCWLARRSVCLAHMAPGVQVVAGVLKSSLYPTIRQVTFRQFDLLWRSKAYRLRGEVSDLDDATVRRRCVGHASWCPCHAVCKPLAPVRNCAVCAVCAVAVKGEFSVVSSEVALAEQQTESVRCQARRGEGCAIRDVQ